MNEITVWGFGKSATLHSRNNIKSTIFVAYFQNKVTVVSGMERSGFPEIPKFRVVLPLFREWNEVDFPKSPTQIWSEMFPTIFHKIVGDLIGSIPGLS